MTYRDVLLQPLKSHKFKVAKPFTFRDIRIPKGFVTDGASVPRIFWSIFPPNRTDYLPCAIIHDYLCDLEVYKKADRCFLECLKHLRVSKFATYTMFIAVRLYHIIRYKE